MKQKCWGCFQSLAAKTRFKIYNLIKDSGDELVVSDLVKATGLRQPTVTFHINELEKAGLISKKKVGREVVCEICCKCPKCPVAR